MSISNVKQMHHGWTEKAGAYLAFLNAMNDPAVDDVTQQLRQAIDQSTQAVNAATQLRSKHQGARRAALDADAKLGLAVSGTMAIIEATRPELWAKLAPDNGWSAMAPPERAAHIQDALKAVGTTEALQFAAEIEAVWDRRKKAYAAWMTADAPADTAHHSSAEVARLKACVLNADAVLSALITPGSPLFDRLKKVRRAGRRSSARKPTAGAPEASDSDVSAPPAEPAAVPPTPTALNGVNGVAHA